MTNATLSPRGPDEWCSHDKSDVFLCVERALMEKEDAESRVGALQDAKSLLQFQLEALESSYTRLQRRLRASSTRCFKLNVKCAKLDSEVREAATQMEAERRHLGQMKAEFCRLLDRLDIIHVISGATSALEEEEKRADALQGGDEDGEEEAASVEDTEAGLEKAADNEDALEEQQWSTTAPSSRKRTRRELCFDEAPQTKRSRSARAEAVEHMSELGFSSGVEGGVDGGVDGGIREDGVGDTDGDDGSEVALLDHSEESRLEEVETSVEPRSVRRESAAVLDATSRKRSLDWRWQVESETSKRRRTVHKTQMQFR